MNSARTPDTMNSNTDSCQNKDNSDISVLNINSEDETKKIDTPGTSLDNSRCNTPIYSSNLDLDAPLSPVLSNSKHSLKYIARKKSRIKLMSKFSQSSNSASQHNLTGVTRIENISPLTIRNESVNTYNSISNANKQMNVNPKNDISDVGDRMQKIKELQRNKKFCYNIDTVALKTSCNAEPRNIQSEVNFKIPHSPAIVSSKTTATKTSDSVNYKIIDKCPLVIPDVKLDVGFQTGTGKEIKLSERALMRAVKLFDDITDLSSESADKNICLLGVKSDNVKCDLDKSSFNKQHSELASFEKDTSYKNTVGFKTANKKMVAFSETPVSKVNNLFEDIFELSYCEKKPEISNVSDLKTSVTSNDAVLNSVHSNEEDFKTPTVKINKDTYVEHKNINFTQANDSQMCWVADNAASMVELVNNEWSSSSSNSQHNSDNSLTSDSNQNSQPTVLKTEEDFQNSQEMDLLLGNLTILDRTSHFCINNDGKSSGSQLSNFTNTDWDEFSSQESCAGFTNEENLQSLKIVELYKRSINYIEADLKKDGFYPISFIFDDVQRSIEYKNKNLRYSLRSGNKPSVTYVSNKRKSTRGKQTQETVKQSRASQGNKRKSVDINSAPSSNNNSQDVSSRTRKKTSILKEEITNSNITQVLDSLENISSVFDSTFSDTSAKLCDENALNSQNHAKRHIPTNSNINTSELLNLGFSTASGKKVNISSSSLLKVKNMFDDCSVLNENDYCNETLNKVHTAVKKSECILDDVTPNINNNYGFTTAAGNCVKISEESLKKVRNIFDDIDSPSEEKSHKLETPKGKINFGFSTASGKKVNISEEALMKSKHIFQDCDLVHENESKINNCGFSTAAGKSIKMSEESLKKVRNIFDDLDMPKEDMSRKEETLKESFGFSTASGKGVKISEKSLKKARKLFDECDVPEENTTHKINTASGKNVPVNKDSLKKVKRSFDEDNSTNSETPKNSFQMGFSTASGKKVEISEDARMKTRNFFDNCEDSVEDKVTSLQIPKSENLVTPKMDMKFGFATASGKKVNISENSLKKARSIFEDVENNENSHKSVVSESYQCGFATASGKSVKISEESLKKIQNIFEGCEETKDAAKLAYEDETNGGNGLQVTPFASPAETQSPRSVCNESTPVLRHKLLASRGSKKRSLGVSSCRQIIISDNSLKRAKLVFDDIPKKKEDISININNNLVSKCVTPVRNVSSPVMNQNVASSVVTPENQNLSIKQITQIENSPAAVTKRAKNDLYCDNSSPFLFKEETQGDTNQWKMNLKEQYDMLKLKMSVIETRMQMLNQQEEMCQDRKQRPGQLYQQKTTNSERISLQEIVNNRRPGKNTYERCLAMGIKPFLLDINAENASKLHFNVPWYSAIIHTEDGAVIVPNHQNHVGITEIESGFRVIPGVDSNLMPKRWIANHYKWIVWKLASMERNYPEVFSNYLSIENVVAQLKYRYDREIDRAQRPALRKILECDDTAAKRMVLCVASIIKLSDGKHDLELTDGWYSIRTTIDGPLTSLVDRGVIKMGMKLMIQGAELVNCEGCCPLETPANVRLQIHYNSTRRAAWYVRLGYQRNPGPLCISLRTINGNGGPIGLTCAYVTRVYPISYMERLDAALVWRNRKAEQRTANQWESRQAQVMERLQAKVQEELEIEWKKGRRAKNRGGKVRVQDIKGLQCARTLYEFLEDSNDPDSIREMMTCDQCLAVQEYQSRLTMDRQAEITSKLRQKLAVENIKPRNVSSVLKLLLLDVNRPLHSRVLSIWRPTDSHLQELKEGNVVRMYNVTARNNGSLSSVPRTQFDSDLHFDTQKFEEFKRTVAPISQTTRLEFKPLFNEFDTAGMVCFVDVQQTNQTLWLADENFRFLLIQIREGPVTCCLLDGLVLGKIIAVTNLVHQKPLKCYGEALANHCTTISSYPNQSYLQDFMKEFIENLPQDADKYLVECKDQVEIFLAEELLTSKVMKTIIMDCDAEVDDLKTKAQQNGESLTLSDEEMSLIDTQML
ncbi:BRCA2 DNA repair associated [Carabus blaptoides fortunei]